MKKNQIPVMTKPAQIMPIRAKMAEVGTEVGWMVPEPWVKAVSARGWRGVVVEVVEVVVRRVRVVKRVWIAERESGMGAMVMVVGCVVCYILERRVDRDRDRVGF